MLMRVKIRIDTLSDARSISEIANKIEEKVTLEDNTGNVVSAKSLLGAIYTMEFNEIWCCCEKDITSLLSNWII